MKHKLKILSVVGARPNFIKVSPLYRIFATDPQIVPRLVHTGQHYDEKMSDVFFSQLHLPEPDHFLEVGSGNRSFQLSAVRARLKDVLEIEDPDILLVVGDVNSTLAAAQAGVLFGIPVVHVEAGLRSHDLMMPEEINRKETDHLSDLLFVTEESARTNLLEEGVEPTRIKFVGNVMIDSLVQHRNAISTMLPHDILSEDPGKYAVMTMHRPSNVDEERALSRMVDLVYRVTNHFNVVFPVHPRTLASLSRSGLFSQLEDLTKGQPFKLILVPPLGYLEFLGLMARADVVLTDSGGIQEETTFLGVPCLTLRQSTERPVTISDGSNTLVPGLNADLVDVLLGKIKDGTYKKGGIPELWDGVTAQRITTILKKTYLDCEGP